MPSNKRILIVDDDPLVRMVTQHYIEQLGLVEKTKIVATSSEALMFLFEQNCDLVFLDIGLPDISGLTLCKNMRKIKPQGLSIIGWTGSADSYAAACETKDFNFVQQKPMRLEDMAALIKEWLKEDDE